MEESGLERTKKLREEAMRRHLLYRGKMQVMPMCSIKELNDFSVYYTPGVAAPCQEIEKTKEKVNELTNKWNTVAVVSDGTRVLGLGNIGPEAGLPVMEGKALLFKYLGGVDAFPICLDTKKPDEIIQAVKWLQPSFGGINLEDISNPKCFYILDALKEKMDIPVWHDDQQGTAVVTLASLMNALKLVDKKMKDVSIAIIGTGAANIAISRLLFVAGINPKNCLAVDSKGILYPTREDFFGNKKYKYAEKFNLSKITNPEKKKGKIAEALDGADICIALSKSGPGVIKPKWIKTMNNDAIVFACANPIPEIWPEEAKKAGAKIVATGRSDFPNQTNNSVVFPGLFRGVLDVQAKTITDTMCIIAAESLAKFARKNGINENYIIPTMEETDAFIEEAVAVGMQAQKEGLTKLKLNRSQLHKKAKTMIFNAQESVKLLMKKKLIPNY